MARFFVIVLVAWVAVGFASTQDSGQHQGESSSKRQPAPPASPADAPTPDQGTQTVPQSNSKAKRVINKLDPHCIDAIFHTCWSSPAAASEKPISEEDLVAKDIEIGYYYLREKNYVAAESRLEEAVKIKQNSPDALVGLAQAQQKLGKREAARKSYEAYLELKPEAADAEKVRQALGQLKSQ